MENHVCMALLHKHYDLGSDEVNVRSYKDSVFEISPRANVDSEVLPFMWQLDGANSHPTEFVSKTQDEGDLLEKFAEVQSSKSFLREVSMKLKHANLFEVLGLALVFNATIHLPQGQVFAEETDTRNRVSVARIIPVENSQSKETIETTWVARNETDTRKPFLSCRHTCSHCKPRPDP
jgi:hypothetical protein